MGRASGQRVVWCDHNHRVVSCEPAPCDAGHDHEVYRCRMRLGNRRCGWSRMIPEMGSGCTKEAEKEDE